MFSSRIPIPILLGIIGLVLAWCGNPLFIPDSYEQGIVAECWRYGSSTRMDCDSIFPWFRPPFPSLLLTPLLDWIDSFTALLLLCWASTVALCGIILHRIRSCFNDESNDESNEHWLTVPIVLLGMAGLFVDLGLLADSKVLALPLVFGAWSLTLSKSLNPMRSFCVGILLGLAFLTRFENLLLIVVGLPVIALYASRRWFSSLCYLSGTTPFVGGWIWILHQETGRLTLSPRYWEQWILLLLDELPLRWAQELYGMGIWNTPLRSLALESTLQNPTKSLLNSFSMTEWLSWLNMNILSLFHPVVVGIFVIQLVLWVRDRQMQKWLVTLLWISLPSIAITVLPQGRESIFPVAYVLPLWCSVWIWIGVSSTLILTRLDSLWPKLTILTSALTLTQLPTSIEQPDNLELTLSGQAVQHWLRMYTPENSIVLSSFENAPIVWLAERQWQEWPSPWESNRRIPTIQAQETPLYGLVWVFDRHAWYSLSFEERYYEPEAYLYTEGSSFIIYDLTK